ncbi:hypothetical protein [Butyricicoccus sp. Marseille-Q5471]|nr:hypothetical protein [Butyricicoccus sp. Marseille-Q5471]
MVAIVPTSLVLCMSSVPPLTFLPTPYLTAFSTNGCTVSAGMRNSVV